MPLCTLDNSLINCMGAYETETSRNGTETSRNKDKLQDPNN